MSKYWHVQLLTVYSSTDYTILKRNPTHMPLRGTIGNAEKSNRNIIQEETPVDLWCIQYTQTRQPLRPIICILDHPSLDVAVTSMNPSSH